MTIAPLNTADTDIDALGVCPDLFNGRREADRALIPGGTAEAFYLTLAVAGGRHG